MGRTNPTYRDRVSRLETDWREYRRALRHHETSAFDTLWEYARAHADAGGLQNPGDPMDSVLLSICLEQQQTIQELNDRIADLEAQQ